MADGDQNAGDDQQNAGAQQQQSDSGNGGQDRQQQQGSGGGLTQEQVDQIITARLARDRKNERWSDPAYLEMAANHLRDNDEFLAMLGVEVVKEGSGKGGKPDADALQAARQEWEEKALAPVLTREKEKDARIEALTRRDLRRQILEAANDVGVEERFRKPPAPGMEPLIVKMFDDDSAFGWDEDTGDWFARNGDGFAYSAQPKDGRPYKGVLERMREWADTDDAKGFLEARGRAGAGYGGNAGGGRRGVTLEEFKKMSDADQEKLYRENATLYRDLQRARADEAAKSLRDKQAGHV